MAKSFADRWGVPVRAGHFAGLALALGEPLWKAFTTAKDPAATIAKASSTHIPSRDMHRPYD